MGKVLRGSYVDQKLKVASKSVPASPQKTPMEDKSNFKKTQKPNSTKSSPARTVKPTPREEQWVDGPRILKSRVTEGRNLVKGKKETWVDGPKMSNGHTSYGFMDYHKKSMIRKWVENQSILVGKPRQGYKEMTVFKTCDEVRGRGSGQEDEGLPSSSSSHMSISQLPPNKG
jgi:kinesin family protein 26